MIGVIPKSDQITAVEEFFQLFKTPWELYEQGRTYDVVVATADEIPEVETRLLLIYGSETKTNDARSGIAARSRHPGGSLSHLGIRLPIYGEVLTFDERSTGVPCVTMDSGTVGLKVRSTDFTMIRLGYDVFQEVHSLLSAGQPVENAHIPTLEIHINMLRDWILNAGITLLEVPPAPAGHSFIVCLTHDIDFAGIRYHRFDHSMWGFLYRSTVGAIRNFCRGRISTTRLFKIWRAAASLPFVYLGWAKDFWDPFEWYLRVEKNLPATYFFIPFKGRPGENVDARFAVRRASAYDITDLPQWTATLMNEGYELGVHGIDAWHSVEKGRDELARIAAVTGESRIGIRMHWLLRDENTFRVLEEAGYAYDSSVGYNESIGYASGTTQPFRPWGTQAFLELPLHIQDGALFFPQRLDLSEPEAWKRCGELIDNATRFGGVLTLLWHDRSHGPERFWGDFYIRLVQALRSREGWFGTAEQVVGWFRKRREVRFDWVADSDGAARTWLRYNAGKILPPLKIRIHLPYVRQNDGKSASKTASKVVDIPWNGETDVELDELLRIAAGIKPSAFDLNAEMKEAAGRSDWGGPPDSSPT
jgi:peptidoglycan/xylan/chitin deacetylase (PgdA/CDA1 family)